jgi:hypothetical protein
MNFICHLTVCIGREITSFTNWFVTGSLLLCTLHLNRLFCEGMELDKTYTLQVFPKSQSPHKVIDEH